MSNAQKSRNGNQDVVNFMEGLKARNPHEPEFQQAVQEVLESIVPYMADEPRYRDAQILERLTEPDRVIVFRVSWMDDKGNVQTNRAWRVQFNNAIGPYKGGLRFHPTVTQSVLKFLAFEQVFKNSLTGLPMGGGKGGSNFDPKGKSDGEVMRFCQSFMTELSRHIGENTDVPAGDIGVGGREIGYLFGQYKRLHNRFAGVITGKGLPFGGSLIRPQATGYGAVFFLRNMLAARGDGLEDKTAAVSGSGNVALYAIEKLNQLGARVVTASDSSGYIHDPAGIDPEKLEFLRDLKEVRRGRIREYADKFKGVEYFEGKRPWNVPVQLAVPCATQNELHGPEANVLVSNGVLGVSEGANMPSTLDAVHTFLHAKVAFGPGKAANSGGVAVSGLEQSQNAMRVKWNADEVEQRLERIMEDVHQQCVEYGRESKDFVDYVKGSNVAGFRKVADAMIAQGVV